MAGIPADHDCQKFMETALEVFGASDNAGAAAIMQRWMR